MQDFRGIKHVYRNYLTLNQFIIWVLKWGVHRNWIREENLWLSEIEERTLSQESRFSPSPFPKGQKSKRRFVIMERQGLLAFLPNALPSVCALGSRAGPWINSLKSKHLLSLIVFKIYRKFLYLDWIPLS